MIRRNIESVLTQRTRSFPIVTVTGPRQAGKTTLCRATFPNKPYVSLEPPDVRQFAVDDPRGFLARYRDGAIIDEVQRAPDLLSYLQADVDDRRDPGRFILTLRRYGRSTHLCSAESDQIRNTIMIRVAPISPRA